MFEPGEGDDRTELERAGDADFVNPVAHAHIAGEPGALSVGRAFGITGLARGLGAVARKGIVGAELFLAVVERARDGRRRNRGGIRDRIGFGVWIHGNTCGLT